MHKYILMLHVVSATVWAGGHLILVFTILPKVLKTKNIESLLSFELGFEKIGIPSLIIQVITGAWMAHDLIPNIKSWFWPPDQYAHLVTYKILFLLLTIGLAFDARLRILPNLNEKNLKSLAWHIISVTILAVLFIIVGCSFRSGGF